MGSLVTKIKEFICQMAKDSEEPAADGRQSKTEPVEPDRQQPKTEPVEPDSQQPKTEPVEPDSQQPKTEPVDLVHARWMLRSAEVITEQALDALGEAIAPRSQQPASEPKGDIVRLHAAVEYLDSSLRLRLDPDRLNRFAKVAEVAACDIKALSTNPTAPTDPTDPIASSDMLDSYRLSALVSVRLASESLTVPDGRIEATVRKILQDKPNQSKWTEHSLWCCRVAADALDATVHPQARQLLKKLSEVASEDAVDGRWEEVRQKTLKSLRSSSAAVTDADLKGAVEGLKGSLSAPGTELPVISATDPNRHRMGKGLLEVHARTYAWDRLQLIEALLRGIGVAAMSLVLLFVLRNNPLDGDVTFWDLTKWDLRPFNVGISQADALNVNLQLLATCAALTIALAVASRSTDPRHREATNRWWAIGSAALRACAYLGMFLGLLMCVSTSRQSNTVAALTILLGVIMLVLVAGIGSLTAERHVEWAHYRHQLAMIKRSLADLEKPSGDGDPKEGREQKTAGDQEKQENQKKARTWMAVFCCAPPAVGVCIVIGVTLVSSARSVPLLVWGGVLFFFFAATTTWLAAGWAISVHEQRYRRAKTASDKAVLVLDGVTVVLLPLVVLLGASAVAFTYNTHAAWGLLLVTVVLVFQTAVLVISVTGPGRRLKRPQFPRQLAKINLERRRARMQSYLQRR